MAKAARTHTASGSIINQLAVDLPKARLEIHNPGISAHTGEQIDAALRPEVSAIAATCASPFLSFVARLSIQQGRSSFTDEAVLRAIATILARKPAAQEGGEP